MKQQLYGIIYFAASLFQKLHSEKLEIEAVNVFLLREFLVMQ